MAFSLPPPTQILRGGLLINNRRSAMRAVGHHAKWEGSHQAQLKSPNTTEITGHNGSQQPQHKA
jgi:hypothetical protein